MNGIYEELYQGLLNEGIDDDIATAVVNRMYEAEELHDVEVLDEGLFKAATVIGKIAAKAMGFGKVSACLLYTSPSPRDLSTSRMPSSA